MLACVIGQIGQQPQTCVIPWDQRNFIRMESYLWPFPPNFLVVVSINEVIGSSTSINMTLSRSIFAYEKFPSNEREVYQTTIRILISWAAGPWVAALLFREKNYDNQEANIVPIRKRLSEFFQGSIFIIGNHSNLLAETQTVYRANWRIQGVDFSMFIYLVGFFMFQ